MITKEQQEKILKHGRAVMAQNSIKPGSKAALKFEYTFFHGVVGALDAIYPGTADGLSPEVPPAWVMFPLSQRHLL